MSFPHLELYYFPSCSFCQRVIIVIDQFNLNVEYKNIIQNPAFKNKLFQDTHKTTVPCLYIDGKPMHESSDIINWLKQNEKNLQKKS